MSSYRCRECGYVLPERRPRWWRFVARWRFANCPQAANQWGVHDVEETTSHWITTTLAERIV